MPCMRCLRQPEIANNSGGEHMKNSRHRMHKMAVRVHGELVRLAYSVCLSPDANPPVILLHGMGSSRLAYQPLMDAWPFPGSVYALDMPGFGASGHLRQRHTLSDYVEAVHAFIVALGLDSVVLLGHSFGGMVAGEVVAHHPQQVRGAVLVSSAGLVPPSNVFVPSRYICLNRIGIWVTGLSYFGDRMVTALGMDSLQLTAEDRWRLRYGWRKAIEMARMGQFYEDAAFFRGVVRSGRPVVLIHGERDPVFSYAAVRDVVGVHFPILTMPQVGHLPFDQNFPRFCELLVDAMAIIQTETS